MSWLLGETARFDEVDFSAEPYAELDPTGQKVRHIGEHCINLAVKLLHAEVDQAAALGDLGIYTCQLMTICRVEEPGELAVPVRGVAMAQRAVLIGSQAVLNSAQVAEHLPRSSMAAAVDLTKIRNITLPNFASARLALAEAWQIDPDEAQLSRMDRPELGLKLI